MDSLWKFLLNNDLVIDTSNISPLLKCNICSSIMKQSMVTTCGCTFCNECIRSYLGENSMCCPSCVKDNAFNELSYNKDVSECKNANKEIFKMIVKCPQNGCTFSCELRTLLHHLQTCNITREYCVLRPIGCSSPCMDRGIMDKHLKGEMKLHLNLVAEILSVLQSGLESLHGERNKFNEMRNDVSFLKTVEDEIRVWQDEESLVLQTATREIGGLGTKNSDVHQIVQQCMNELSALKREISHATSNLESVETEMKRIKEETSQEIGDLKEKSATLSTQVTQEIETKKAQLLKSNESQENDVRVLKEKTSLEIGKLMMENASLKAELNSIKEDLYKERLCRESFNSKIEQFEKSVEHFKLVPNLSEHVYKSVQCEVKKKSLQNLLVENCYHWTPFRLSLHNYQWRWSEKFSIRGYSMRLKMAWFKPANIGTRLFVLRSADDAKLTWPMRLHLRLMLAEPESKRAIKSVKIDCICNRPGKEKVCLDEARIDISLDAHSEVKRTDSILVTVDVI